MAHQEACQLFIEQEIQEGLAQGKTPYSIGKELAAWVERVFETNVPARTIEQKARRVENATNVASPTTSPNLSENPEKQSLQEVAPIDLATKPGPGRQPKYTTVEPYTTGGSQALHLAGIAISQLERIHPSDSKRNEAFQKVINWITKQLNN